MTASFGGVIFDCMEGVCGVRLPSVVGAVVRCGVGRKFAGLGATKGESSCGSSEGVRALS